MFTIIFLSILVLVVLLCIAYYLFSYRSNFSNKDILNFYKSFFDVNKPLKRLVKLSIIKVNGWNKLTTCYTILHYLFNIFSILFSCVSIYYSFQNANNLSIFCSIIAIFSVTANLFLRCDRKWSTFRKVLAKGRIETNNFIAELKNSEDTQKIKLINDYANKIIELEQSLNDSDIS